MSVESEMSSEPYFPEFMRALPQPDSPLEGLEAWMLQTGQAMAMFFELPEGVHVPEHAHGAQWGVVLEGSLEFTIGGETRVYQKGDTYFVPAGVPHEAVIHPGYVGIDVFADANRYRAKEPPPERAE
jgi:quercetin dioxygenase-like cupin family protein